MVNEWLAALIHQQHTYTLSLYNVHISLDQSFVYQYRLLDLYALAVDAGFIR